MRDLTNIVQPLYESDEHQWMLDQIAHLREKRYESIDYGNLLQYLTEMTARDRRDLESRFAILLQHLLKFQVQPQCASRSWETTVLTQQNEINKMLKSTPSLKHYAPALFSDAFLIALRLAARDTRIPLSKFPTENPWTIKTALEFDPPQR